MPATNSKAARPSTAADRFRLRRIPPRQAFRVFCALVFASAACVAMVVARSVVKDSGPTSRYLLWNLALAWIPLGFAFSAYRCFARRGGRNLSFISCALAWFFFFPNAPYITTDVVHIHDDHLTASWFQLISIMAYAWTGLSLGYISLYLMQEVVRARFGRLIEWLFVLVMLGAATLGIYLGRFLRWNSWDLLHHTFWHLRKAYQIAQQADRPEGLTFKPLMFVFLLLSYGILYSLTHLHENQRPPDDSR